MITALLHTGVAVADVFGEVSEVLRQRVGLLLATAALIVVDINAGSSPTPLPGTHRQSSNSRAARFVGSTTQTRR